MGGTKDREKLKEELARKVMNSYRDRYGGIRFDERGPSGRQRFAETYGETVLGLIEEAVSQARASEREMMDALVQECFARSGGGGFFMGPRTWRSFLEKRRRDDRASGDDGS